MAITVTAGNKPIELALDANNKIDFSHQQFKDFASFLNVSPGELQKILENVTFTDGAPLDVNSLVEAAVNQTPTNEATMVALIEKAEEISGVVEKLSDELKSLKVSLESAKTDEEKNKINDQIKANKELKTALEGEYNDAVRAAKAALNKSETLGELSAETKKKAANLAEVKLETTASDDGPLGTTTKAGSLGGTPSTGGSGGTGKATSFGDIPKAGNFGGDASSLDPMSMMKASIADDNLLSLVDMSGEAKKRQQMMLLFFHYARMAMSGDLYAMYQFMRFLSYVIGRDKALQNVAIGTKLIELQEVSRRAQEALTGLKVGEDSQSQADFQAKLQQIRGEENMVATSQKLLTQMMEEYTGIKSSLDDVTKSMLDSWASSLKSSSTWRI